MRREEYLNVKNILIRMIELEVSREELANRLDISEAALSTILSTKRTSLGTAIKLSRALGLTPNQILVGWKDSEDNPENLSRALVSDQSRAMIPA